MSEKRNIYVGGVSPHILAESSTRKIMLDVLIALIPAVAVSTYMFGTRVLALCGLSMLACVFFEWLYRFLLKKPLSIDDLSAPVTGLLLAMCLPVTTPYWVLLFGDFFAIVIVKQLYGGIGKNFMNPAMAGRVFLFIAFPGYISDWQKPLARLGVFSSVDAVTAATTLADMSEGTLPKGTTLMQMLIGERGGSLGEVAILALLLGGVYLLLRKVITLRIPFAYLATVAVLTFLFPRGNDSITWMLYQLCSGGLVLGAIFMATDYSSSPVTRGGQWMYGIGCGLITVFIRYFGSYPEGVSFAVLVMNACSALFDKWGRPRRFGTKRFAFASKGKEGAKNGN